MKLAFCVEGESDQKILASILSSLLGTRVEPDTTTYLFRRGGIESALQLAPRVARHAHHAGLHGAVFAVDNDGQPTHVPEHVPALERHCRVCRIRRAAQIDEVLTWPRPGLPRIVYLFAVPVQAIESWLLLVRGHSFKMALETIGVDAGGRRQLKRELYGVEGPDQRLMWEIAEPILTRLDAHELSRRSRSFAELHAQVKEAMSALIP